jgi:hypothetical protein
MHPGFEVNTGYGLHTGWAIEGAIGSNLKIDASYLSSNVNLASRIEAATKQYRVRILLSEHVASIMSLRCRVGAERRAARRRVREGGPLAPRPRWPCCRPADTEPRRSAARPAAASASSARVNLTRPSPSRASAASSAAVRPSPLALALALRCARSRCCARSTA